MAEIDGEAVLFLDGDDGSPRTRWRDWSRRWTRDPRDRRLWRLSASSPRTGGRASAVQARAVPGGRHPGAAAGTEPVRQWRPHADPRRRGAPRRSASAATSRYGEDWEFWCRLALAGRFAMVPGTAPLLFVRRRGGSAMLRLASQPRALPARAWTRSSATPPLLARLGAARTAALRAAGGGGELLDHRPRTDPPRPPRRRAALAAPLRPRRGRAPGAPPLLAAAHVLPLLPARLRGPFRSYRSRVLTAGGRHRLIKAT